tara:strand:- start:2333 stop:3484 length:1152 start_codon:yes stop_codon:yes gene_type:complete
MRAEFPRATPRRVPFAPLRLGDPIVDDDHTHDVPRFGGDEYAPRRVIDGDLQCMPSEEQEGEPFDNQFRIRRAWEACWRTLWHNAPPPAPDDRYYWARRAHSMLGPYGHIERANAWTHVVGALAFAIFSFVRVSHTEVFDNLSTSGQLSAVSAAATVVTFAISTAYHSFAGVRTLSPAFRMLDHGIILTALAIASAADTCVATLNFFGVPWQTVAEPFCVACVLLVYFSYRRFVLDVEQTEVAWGNCHIGLFRFQHVDLDASSFRTSGYVAIGFLFVQLVPVAFTNLRIELASLSLAANLVGLLMLTAGLVLDNIAILPDLWYQQRAMRRDAPKGKRVADLWFHNRKCGCICTAHAFWHVAALLATVVQAIGREVVISNTFLG